MSSERLEFSVEKLGRALDRLDEVLALPGEGPMIDATIQRFEFTVELFWRTLKRGIEERGRSVPATPADAVSAAWQADWLEEDEDFWIGMLKDRNRTSHLYEESAALEVYGRIRDYAPAIRRAYKDLCRRFRLAPAGPKPGPSEAREPRVRYRKTSARPATFRRVRKLKADC
jgi:nucleotidyltransferase substrate binding protein (TIGR01987 family)